MLTKKGWCRNNLGHTETGTLSSRKRALITGIGTYRSRPWTSPSKQNKRALCCYYSFPSSTLSLMSYFHSHSNPTVDKEELLFIQSRRKQEVRSSYLLTGIKSRFKATALRVNYTSCGCTEHARFQHCIHRATKCSSYTSKSTLESVICFHVIALGCVVLKHLSTSISAIFLASWEHFCKPPWFVDVF